MMTKRIIAIGVLLIMCLGFFGGCYNNYEYNESDFSLTLTVDKTEAKVGDTVTVTARFANLSGRDIYVQGYSFRVKQLDEILMLMCVPGYSNLSFIVEDTAGPIPIKIFKKGAVIEKSMEIVIEEFADYIAVAAVIFSVEKIYNKIGIHSEQIKIIIKE